MDKNKKDYLSLTLFYQFIVCALLFGALFVLNRLNNDTLKSIKNEFFDNVQDNTIIEIIENSATDVIENSEPATNENTNDNVTIESEDALIPEVGAGGDDTDLNSETELPSNVSVNNYTLNQKMVLPVKGNLTSEYGVRNHPIRGNLSFHSGIDIAAEKGTPIKAAFDGIVTESEYDQWNGYHIKIQHDNGVMTVYCHCDELLVNKGATIKAGDIIAKVGSTGSSTGPHLHFEFRINDISYNPQFAIDEAIDAV